MAERILRNTPATLSVTFYGDGVPVDTDTQTATVTITKADGTAIVTDGATVRTGVGIHEYTLTGQAELNTLTIAWSGVFSSETVTIMAYAEIVGGFLFTEAALRAYDSQLTDTTKYPSSRILEIRDEVEHELEDSCGHRAFVPRFAREILSGDGTTELWLKYPEPLTVNTLTFDDVDVLSSSDLRADRDAKRLLLIRDAVWPVGYDNIVIEYEYGHSWPPPRVVAAAKKLARHKLVAQRSRIDERATLMNIPDFGTFELSTPGKRGAITGIPEVDKVIYDYELPENAR